MIGLMKEFIIKNWKFSFCFTIIFSFKMTKSWWKKCWKSLNKWKFYEKKKYRVYFSCLFSMLMQIYLVFAHLLLCCLSQLQSNMPLIKTLFSWEKLALAKYSTNIINMSSWNAIKNLFSLRNIFRVSISNDSLRTVECG